MPLHRSGLELGQNRVSHVHCTEYGLTNGDYFHVHKEQPHRWGSCSEQPGRRGAGVLFLTGTILCLLVPKQPPAPSQEECDITQTTTMGLS